MYWGKLSLAGKQNTELSYVFADDITEQKNSSVLLFGIFDIKSLNEVYHTIIRQTVKHFLDFYHTPSLFETVSHDEFLDAKEFIFEHSIQYTYEKVSDALREMQENSSTRHVLDIKKINCIIGALIDTTLYLSITGATIQPLLIYPVVHRKGPRQYMLVNILESNGEQLPDTSARLFSQLISGPIQIPGSSIVLCNQTFIDYVSAQQLKQTIANTQIQRVIPTFEHLLSRVNARNDFSALLIAPGEYEQPSSMTYRTAAPASSSSMADLNDTTESTHSILTPTVGPLLVQFFRGLFHILQFSARIIRSWLVIIWHALTAPDYRKHWHSINTESKKLIRYSVRSIALRSLFQVVKDGTLPEKCAYSIFNMRSRIRQASRTLHRRFLSLPPISRSLLILSMLFIVLFLISLITIYLRREGEQKESLVREIIVGVEQKIIAADASLLYDDRARAQDLVTESKDLLALIHEKRRQRDDYRRVSQSLESLELKIHNVIRVDEPLQLATIPAHQAKPFRLIATDETILLYSGDTIYHYDREKKKLNELSTHEKIPSISCVGVRTQNKFYFCSETGDRIYFLELPDMIIRSYALNVPEEGQNPTAISFYNDRLYSFSARTGKLFRSPMSGDTLSSGLLWLRDSDASQQLIDARDFTIDGLVYFLTKDGELRIFRSGKPQELSIPQDIAELLSSANRILTNDKLDHLYALDQKNKRINVIHKRTFSVVAQLTSPAFQQPSDFAISKKRKTVLVYDSGRLLSFPFDVR